MMQENDDLSLLAEVAHLYYEENYTQEQIAKVIGVSRSGVSRLLTRSREMGLVDIYVHHTLRTSVPLQNELVELFGLRDAQVLLNTAPTELILNDVGALAARYIDRRIQETQLDKESAVRTVGVSWGFSLRGVVKSLRPRRRLPLHVVQLEGSVDAFYGPDIDTPELARGLAEVYGAARCHYLHAPLLVADAQVREGLLKEPGLHRTFQVMNQMDMALVGIGGVQQETSSLFARGGYLSDDILQDLYAQGAVGEICGGFFTVDGRLCTSRALERMITVPFAVLRAVPEVVAVAAGEAKANAIVGALRTGAVNVLVTDELCARAIIQLVKESTGQA